jgi:programmed cell death protein 5
MDDLEALRQRRLRELQAAQARAPAQDPGPSAEASAQAAADERERLVRIRMSRPDLADAVTRQLVALAQQGRLARRLTDADLRSLLARIPSTDRDIKITRK